MTDSKHCHICKVELDQPGKPETEDCGGDCLECMAIMGDPECVAAMVEIRREQQSGMYHDEYLGWVFLD